MREPDPALIAACRNGDPAALRRLVEDYQQPVYALCIALAGHDGEDLAHETFLRVFRAIGQFDPAGPATLRAWILCIARRLCADRARHLGHGVEVAVTPPDVADPTAGPDEQLDAEWLRVRLIVALGSLPEDQRLVIALREWEGLEYEEIAGVAGVPVGTVRSRLARARAALRQALGDGVAESTRSPRVARA